LTQFKNNLPSVNIPTASNNKKVFLKKEGAINLLILFLEKKLKIFTIKRLLESCTDTSASSVCLKHWSLLFKNCSSLYKICVWCRSMWNSLCS